jgi:hypothetical protein
MGEDYSRVWSVPNRRKEGAGDPCLAATPTNPLRFARSVSREHRDRQK